MRTISFVMPSRQPDFTLTVLAGSPVGETDWWINLAPHFVQKYPLVCPLGFGRLYTAMAPSKGGGSSNAGNSAVMPYVDED